MGGDPVSPRARAPSGRLDFVACRVRRPSSAVCVLFGLWSRWPIDATDALGRTDVGRSVDIILIILSC